MDQLVGKDAALLEKALALSVLQHDDAARDDHARADAAVGIGPHLGDEQPAVLIERQRHRIDDVGFASDQLDLEALGQAKGSLFFARRQRTGGRNAGLFFGADTQ